MMKQICKYAGVTLAVAATATLCLPLFTADGLVLRLFDLAELSPWGAVVIAAPLAAAGLALVPLNRGAKALGLLGLWLLGGAALSAATGTARQWIHGLATGFVQPHGTQWVYAALMGLALACLWLALCLPQADPEGAATSEESAAPEDSATPEEPLRNTAPLLPADRAAFSPPSAAESNTRCIINATLYSECAD